SRRHSGGSVLSRLAGFLAKSRESRRARNQSIDVGWEKRGLATTQMIPTAQMPVPISDTTPARQPCGPVQAANAIIAMAAGMVITFRISAPLGRQGHCTRMSTAVKQRQSWSKHLAQTSANTLRLRPRGYDVRAYRRHCRALLMCSNGPSVKLAIHEQREVDLTGQQCRTGFLQQLSLPKIISARIYDVGRIRLA